MLRAVHGFGVLQVDSAKFFADLAQVLWVANEVIEQIHQNLAHSVTTWTKLSVEKADNGMRACGVGN